MDITEVIRILGGGTTVAYMVGAGYLLIKEHVVLGKYHRQIVEERDKTIAKQEATITKLDLAERDARELAWKATDIGQRLANIREQKATDGNTTVV